MVFAGDNWKILTHALSTPSPENWNAIVAIGSALWRSREKNPLFATEMVTFQRALDRLKQWPPELSRDCPEYWPDAWKKIAQYHIAETKTYGYYMVGVCGDARLKLSDGTQGVRLERRFVGAAKSFTGEKTMSIGTKGEPDLSGGMTVEIVYGIPSTRVEVTVGLEVKGPDGKLKPEQEKRIAALKRRGGVAVVARTVEEAVLALLEEQKMIRVRILGAQTTAAAAH